MTMNHKRYEWIHNGKPRFQKKLLAFVVVVAIMLAAIFMSGCDGDPKVEDVNYYCQFTYYDDGHTGGLVVDYYETSDDSTLIEIFKPNGDIWIIDSTQIEMLCVEWEREE